MSDDEEPRRRLTDAERRELARQRVAISSVDKDSLTRQRNEANGKLAWHGRKPRDRA